MGLVRSRHLSRKLELAVTGFGRFPVGIGSEYLAQLRPLTALMLQQMAMRYPNLGRLVQAVFHDTGSTLGSGCDDQYEFGFALDLLLDGLDRLREAHWSLPHDDA